MSYVYKLTKPLHRMFNLLNLLAVSNSPLSKHDVAQAIACSRPTLNKTIIDANHLIKDFSEIKFTDEGLFLAKERPFNKRQIKALICSETFIIQFLTDLFLGKIETIEDWAQSRYYSPSVAYRNIREISDYLDVMDIKLVNDNNYWYLEGDSWKICYMYFQIFKEQAIVGEAWVFEKYDRQLLLKFVKMICDELELFISPIVEYFFTLMTAVQLSLSENPHVLKNVSNEKFQYLLESHEFGEALNFLEKSIGRNIQSDEKARLISGVEFFPVSYLTTEAMYRRIVHSSLTDHQMYQVAFEVYQLFHPCERKIEDFISYLDIFTSLELLNSYQPINFEPPEKISYHFDQKQDQDFLNKLNKLEANIITGELKEYYDINRNLFIQRLYVLYRTYFKEEKPRALTITFLSQDGDKQEAYYANKVLSFFSQEQLRYINSEKVHLEEMWEEIDLIITDYSLVKFDYSGKIFYVDGLINEMDLKSIERLIIQLEDDL